MAVLELGMPEATDEADHPYFIQMTTIIAPWPPEDLIMGPYHHGRPREIYSVAPEVGAAWRRLAENKENQND